MSTNGDKDILVSGLDVMCSNIVILDVIIDSGLANFLLVCDSKSTYVEASSL